MENEKDKMVLYFDVDHIRKISSKVTGVKVYIPFVSVSGKKYRYFRRNNLSRKRDAYNYGKTVIFRYERICAT